MKNEIQFRPNERYQKISFNQAEISNISLKETCIKFGFFFAVLFFHGRRIKMFFKHAQILFSKVGYTISRRFRFVSVH